MLQRKTEVKGRKFLTQNCVGYQSKSHHVRRALSLDVPRITLYPYIPQAPFPASGQMPTLNLTAADQHGPQHHDPVEVMPRKIKTNVKYANETINNDSSERKKKKKCNNGTIT